MNSGLSAQARTANADFLRAGPERLAAIGYGKPLLLVVVAFALLQRLVLQTNTDVSWLITICERMLQGGRLYTDILEVNPPASPLLYLAPTAAARAMGIAPEVAVNACVLGAVAASLIFAGRILRPTGLLDRHDGWALAGWSAAVLTVLPMQALAEREHIATITLIPFLALLVVRAQRAAPPFMMIIVAGLGAGLTIAIKPYFAVPVAFAIAAAAYSARSWRVMFAAENWIAAALAVAYGLWAVLAFPTFVRDVLPLVQTVYVPVRMDLLLLLLRPTFLAWLASLRLLSIWKPGALLTLPLCIPAAAGVGFALCYLWQGKGWPYHSYPALALGLIALAAAGTERTSVEQRRVGLGLWGPRLTIGALAGLCCYWMNLQGDMTPLIDRIRQIKLHPSMLAISADLSTGHPLVREIGGKWVSQVASLWITADSYWQLLHRDLSPTARALLRGYIARDRAMLLDDIRTKRPDVILVERDIFDWYAWAKADPLINAALQDYREVASVPTFIGFRSNGRFVILARDDVQRPAGGSR